MAQQPLFQFHQNPYYSHAVQSIPLTGQVYPQFPAQPAQNPYVQSPPIIHAATTPIPFSAASPVLPATQASSPYRRGGLYSRRSRRKSRSRKGRSRKSRRRSRR